MNMLKVCGLALALVVSGCVAGAPRSGGEIEDVGSAAEAIVPVSVPTTRVYVDHDNIESVSDAAPYVHGLFDLAPGGHVGIDLTGSAHGVGFKLYRVTSAGHLSLLRSVDGPSGEASTTLTSAGGGSYVVELVSNHHPDTLDLSIDCLRQDGHCTPHRQPDQTCGGIAGFTCDVGLYCNTTASASCGAGDQGGKCAIKPQICPMYVLPICGCDGKTYSNPCRAETVGVSPAHPGACH
jgi:hypothetical protein